MLTLRVRNTTFKAMPVRTDLGAEPLAPCLIGVCQRPPEAAARILQASWRKCSNWRGQAALQRWWRQRCAEEARQRCAEEARSSGGARSSGDVGDAALWASVAAYTVVDTWSVSSGASAVSTMAATDSMDEATCGISG